jgi:CBS domain-containing protein
MTSSAVTIKADAPITVAGKAMQDRGLKRLPVVDDGGRLIARTRHADGVIATRDRLTVSGA